MILIGFMHYRKNPTNKAYAYAAVAKAEGAEVLYFSPGGVDFNKKIISGYVYQNGEWINTMSKFPDVICNVIGFANEKQDEIAQNLQEVIPFTSYSIGSKATVYNNIMKYKEFSSYLVPSQTILSTEHFFKLLDKYGEIVLKPSMGCQGLNVYYIKRQGDAYEILSGNQKINYNMDQMIDFIADETGKEEYLVQPYINCRTKSGNAYDFRLHVQKNAKGEWVTSQIYPRIAGSGSIVSNISRGGYAEDLTAFLKREMDEEYYDIQKYIERFSLQLAMHMDKIQKEIYKEELDELGIDIGLDQNKRICIYEINWRPGYPPTIKLNLDVIKNAIHYAMHLAGRERKKACIA